MEKRHILKLKAKLCGSALFHSCFVKPPLDASGPLFVTIKNTDQDQVRLVAAWEVSNLAVRHWKLPHHNTPVVAVTAPP